LSRAQIAGLLRDLRALIAVYRGCVPRKVLGDCGPSRVAVVLGAEVLPGGRPSRTLEARALHAARLYAGGEVDLLVPTGGLGKHPPSEAEVMFGILRGEGVPEEAILLEDRALSTWDSAWLVAGILRRRGIECVRVVTDPLHCVRTVAAFGEAGLGARPEPVYGSPMWRRPWSRRGQLVREIGASTWYRTRHGVGSRSRR
jgi:uncharacterized SAM-binding protein YcdF (DUF218 family)